MSLPPALAEIVDDFGALGDSDKITLLLEFAGELPDLPAHLEQDAMEPVPECQSPVFLSVDAADPASVRLHFSAPREAPTTRGFAAILHQGLDTASAREILDVPSDFYYDLGLGSAVSPLRLRGMAGMLGRIKAQVRHQVPDLSGA
ncbi:MULTISPECIES: SufE family protein [Gordonia]|jgi:cysteine desulfuration protein SufE|uniref:Cysteine desulfuration protein SufE n=1 Tax=Gordonia terrae TaxID=2055 RepID=A0A2I1RD97_9ACTN|nr:MULTISPECIES: SufE family protein [Gordonia]MCG7631942.1 SufE family protein [Gordonia sp. McavH-238-E]PKZ67074.1 cysteine desulfuration protein SufE [Gordonia terrae]UPW10959.1 SufE family protein [Gordonia terrae]